MSFILVIPHSVKKELAVLPEKIAGRIIQAMHDIERDPYKGKHLQGNLEGVYSWRVWPYRILYEIRKKELVILVLAIGDRKQIYQK